MVDVTMQTRTGNHLVTGAETAASLSLKDLDVVYVVRPGENNESLRYSLRSLANMPHRKVYLSGECPKWADGVYVVAKDSDMEMPEQEDSNLNLFVAARQQDVSDNFIFMNDDFFIMEPTSEIPVMHQGDLDQRIITYKADHRFHQAYSLIKTKQALIRRGFGPQLLSYELHMPMIFNKKLLLRMFADWDQPLFALRPRTMYGNMYKLNGEFTTDAKNSINPEARFLSTGVDFDISLAGERVRNQFRGPGTYEPPTIS